MVFLWPHLLWLLLAAPALVAAYVFVTRRKQPALRVSSLSLVREATAYTPRWRRHIPPLMFLAALVSLCVATARPAAEWSVAAKDRTVMLAIDVSLSMDAKDIPPSRISAAQAAARKFIRELPRDVRVGIIAFAGAADVVQVPTYNRDHLFQAIDQLRLEHHTSVGTAILASMVTLFPDAGLIGGYDIFGMGGMRDGGREIDVEEVLKAPKNRAEPVPAGSDTTASIILLTDGISTIGMDPRAAAQMAADRGVRIFTLGFGSPGAKVTNEQGVVLDAGFNEDALRAVADITAGEYFAASNAVGLDRAYTRLSGRVVRESRQTEVTSFFTAAAALLLALGAALSFAWTPRFA
jgi:Ca-activated chloride channel family protein